MINHPCHSLSDIKCIVLISVTNGRVGTALHKIFLAETLIAYSAVLALSLLKLKYLFEDRHGFCAFRIYAPTLLVFQSEMEFEMDKTCYWANDFFLTALIETLKRTRGRAHVASEQDRN